MTTISDEYMQQMMTTTHNYSILILKVGPNESMPDARKIIWEHGRRNFALRAAGLLSIVCPTTDDSDVCGLCIFNATPEETKKIMDEDPGVQAGIFTYEIHPCRSFPGDALP